MFLYSFIFPPLLHLTLLTPLFPFPSFHSVCNLTPLPEMHPTAPHRFLDLLGTMQKAMVDIFCCKEAHLFVLATLNQNNSTENVLVKSKTSTYN